VSAFTGPQGKGALRRHRDQKRAAADERATRTTVTRTAAFRRSIARLDGDISRSHP
jgi:hypothetical protein